MARAHIKCMGIHTSCIQYPQGPCSCSGNTPTLGSQFRKLAHHTTKDTLPQPPQGPSCMYRPCDRPIAAADEPQHHRVAN